MIQTLYAHSNFFFLVVEINSSQSSTLEVCYKNNSDQFSIMQIFSDLFFVPVLVYYNHLPLFLILFVLTQCSCVDRNQWVRTRQRYIRWLSQALFQAYFSFIKVVNLDVCAGKEIPRPIWCYYYILQHYNFTSWIGYFPENYYLVLCVLSSNKLLVENITSIWAAASIDGCLGNSTSIVRIYLFNCLLYVQWASVDTESC